MSKWIRFAKERAYLTRSAIVKMIHGVPIAVYKTSQGFKGYVAICPHKYHILCIRELIRGNYIICQGHGEQFSVLTGEPKENIAKEGLKTVDIKVDEGIIYVEKPAKDIIEWVHKINVE